MAPARTYPSFRLPERPHVAPADQQGVLDRIPGELRVAQDEVGDTPSTTWTRSATGYTIIEADSLDAAAAASADHPYLDHGGQVQVFETIDMS